MLTLPIRPSRTAMAWLPR